MCELESQRPPPTDKSQNTEAEAGSSLKIKLSPVNTNTDLIMAQAINITPSFLKAEMNSFNFIAINQELIKANVKSIKEVSARAIICVSLNII
jgi:hypothetical protein